MTYLSLGHHLFTRRINFVNKGGYDLVWDINRAKATILHFQGRLGQEVHELAAEELYPYTYEIERNRLEYAYRNEEPIIVVEYPSVGGWIVIDGNHRVVSRYEKNPKIMIKTIGVSGFFQLNFLPNDYFRKLYVVHQNLFSILNYMIGKISWEQLHSDGGLVHSSVKLEWMDNYFHQKDRIRFQWFSEISKGNVT